MIPSVELMEILAECQEKKHEMHLAQSTNQLGWIEIDVHVSTSTEMHIGQESIQISKVVFSIWIGG